MHIVFYHYPQTIISNQNYKRQPPDSVERVRNHEQRYRNKKLNNVRHTLNNLKSQSDIVFIHSFINSLDTWSSFNLYVSCHKANMYSVLIVLPLSIPVNKGHRIQFCCLLRFQFRVDNIISHLHIWKYEQLAQKSFASHDTGDLIMLCYMMSQYLSKAIKRRKIKNRFWEIEFTSKIYSGLFTLFLYLFLQFLTLAFC